MLYFSASKTLSNAPRFLQELKRELAAKGVLVERLLTRGNHLVHGCTSSSAKVVKPMMQRVQKRWYDITKGIDDSISKFCVLSRDFVEFEEERRSVNAWLTDIEVRLIGLDQVGEEQEYEEKRLQELKVSLSSFPDEILKQLAHEVPKTIE